MYLLLKLRVTVNKIGNSNSLIFLPRFLHDHRNNGLLSLAFGLLPVAVRPFDRAGVGIKGCEYPTL